MNTIFPSSQGPTHGNHSYRECEDGPYAADNENGEEKQWIVRIRVLSRVFGSMEVVGSANTADDADGDAEEVGASQRVEVHVGNGATESDHDSGNEEKLEHVREEIVDRAEDERSDLDGEAKCICDSQTGLDEVWLREDEGGKEDSMSCALHAFRDWWKALLQSAEVDERRHESWYLNVRTLD